MKYTVFLVLGLVLIVAVYLMTRKRVKGDKHHEEHHEHSSSDSGCCGRHANCEKGSDGKELYFDDEELDRFKGVASTEYSDEDVEEFRQVLYTMREEEVENWAHCIETRGIELPAEIKDEILMMLQ